MDNWKVGDRAKVEFEGTITKIEVGLRSEVLYTVDYSYGVGVYPDRAWVRLSRLSPISEEPCDDELRDMAKNNAHLEGGE